MKQTLSAPELEAFIEEKKLKPISSKTSSYSGSTTVYRIDNSDGEIKALPKQVYFYKVNTDFVTRSKLNRLRLEAAVGTLSYQLSLQFITPKRNVSTALECVPADYRLSVTSSGAVKGLLTQELPHFTPLENKEKEGIDVGGKDDLAALLTTQFFPNLAALSFFMVDGDLNGLNIGEQAKSVASVKQVGRIDFGEAATDFSPMLQAVDNSESKSIDEDDLDLFGVEQLEKAYAIDTSNICNFPLLDKKYSLSRLNWLDTWINFDKSYKALMGEESHPALLHFQAYARCTFDQIVAMPIVKIKHAVQLFFPEKHPVASQLIGYFIKRQTQLSCVMARIHHMELLKQSLMLCSPTMINSRQLLLDTMPTYAVLREYQSQLRRLRHQPAASDSPYLKKLQEILIGRSETFCTAYQPDGIEETLQLADKILVKQGSFSDALCLWQDLILSSVIATGQFPDAAYFLQGVMFQAEKQRRQQARSLDVKPSILALLEQKPLPGEAVKLTQSKAAISSGQSDVTTTVTLS